MVSMLLAVVMGAGCGDAGPALSDIGSPPTSPASTAGAAPAPESDLPVATSSVVVPTTVPAPAPLVSSVVTTTTVPPPELSKEWTLLAGGDVLMDRTEPAGIDPFEFIQPALASADIAVVNAEMTISDRGVPVDKEYVFRAPPPAAGRMAAAGINVANLANNHAKDFGSSALVDTVELLEASGVVALGAGASAVDAYRYRILDTVGGVRVAFVGVSMIVPWGFPAGPDSAGIASARPPDPVVDSVRDAATVADVVIAVVHWGIERSTCPSAAQRDFAQQLLDAGATAVIGQHPHVLQPVEFGDGKLVAYSLGNFVWHPRWGITGETGVLEVGFDGSEIVGWVFHPHLLNDDGAPVPVSDGTRHDRITDIIAGRCAAHQPPPPSTTSTTSTEAPTTTGSPPDGSTPTSTEPEAKIDPSTTTTVMPTTDTTAAAGGG